MRMMRGLSIAGLLAGVALFAIAVPAQTIFSNGAQGKKGAEAKERTVQGVVSDAEGNPAVNAVVQLKDTRTQQIRSFIAKEHGDYYFNGLSPDIDYELRADAKGASSSTKTLSSYDSRKQATINLKLK